MLFGNYEGNQKPVEPSGINWRTIQRNVQVTVLSAVTSCRITAILRGTLWAESDKRQLSDKISTLYLLVPAHWRTRPKLLPTTRNYEMYGEYRLLGDSCTLIMEVANSVGMFLTDCTASHASRQRSSETESDVFRKIGRHSSVGTATRYRRDGPGIEFRWRQNFLHSSKPALGPTQPLLQWVPDLFV
jgi:hypothetical protein